MEALTTDNRDFLDYVFGVESEPASVDYAKQLMDGLLDGTQLVAEDCLRTFSERSYENDQLEFDDNRLAVLEKSIEKLPSFCEQQPGRQQTIQRTETVINLLELILFSSPKDAGHLTRWSALGRLIEEGLRRLSFRQGFTEAKKIVMTSERGSDWLEYLRAVGDSRALSGLADKVNQASDYGLAGMFPSLVETPVFGAEEVLDS